MVELFGLLLIEYQTHLSVMDILNYIKVVQYTTRLCTDYLSKIFQEIQLHPDTSNLH